MPVFNKMVYNGTEYILGGGGNIGEPLNLTVTTIGLDATIKWEDNEIGTIPPTTFQKSELVRKIGSAPTSPSDGDLVVTETVKDTYKTTGYVDQGLTDGETYYYRVFSYSDLGGISYCDAVSVTVSGGWQPGANTILYYDFEHTSGTTETNLATTGNTYDGIYSTTPTIGALASGKKYFDTGGTIYSATSSGFSTVDYSNATVCVWLNPQDTQARAYFGQSWWGTPGGGTASGLGTIFCEKTSSTYNVELGQTYGKTVSASNIPVNTWTCLTITDYNETVTIYCNGVQVTQGTNEYAGVSNNTKLCIGGAYSYGEASPINIGDVWYGSVIVENKVRTAQEIADYYNLTKGDYGIS